jgi:hypothetical protein
LSVSGNLVSSALGSEPVTQRAVYLSLKGV